MHLVKACAVSPVFGLGGAAVSRGGKAPAHRDAAQRRKAERLAHDFNGADRLPEAQIHTERHRAVCHTAAHGIGVSGDVGETGAADETRVLPYDNGKDALPADVRDGVGDAAVAGSHHILTEDPREKQKEDLFFFFSSFRNVETGASVTVIPEAFIFIKAGRLSIRSRLINVPA